MIYIDIDNAIDRIFIKPIIPSIDMNTDINILAQELFEIYGLSDWSFRYGMAVNLFGNCNRATKTITMSKLLIDINSDEVNTDTLLHEIAHALAPRFSHHGKDWQEIAQCIGASPTRCTNSDVKTPKALYTVNCKHCNYTYQANRKTRISCGKCSPRFNKKYLLKFTKNI
ncbi:SprT-like domain-containing protein [Candidatus Dojkabacteria bacterium]|jgi:hypothetical protein|nr:SprT-like domain-containing protein [Candidatus Dojkabacteria bacterium]